MPWIRTPDGATVHVHMTGQRRRNCRCGRRASLQCDWPAPERKSGTCDKAICEACARKDGEKDYCPFHRGAPAATEPTQAELELAGETEADKVAKMLGVKR